MFKANSAQAEAWLDREDPVYRPGWSRRPLKIGFLFNHEAPHQIAHSAPIARHMAIHSAGFEVTVLATSEMLRDHARQLIESEGGGPIGYVLLKESGMQRRIGRWLDAAVPFSRIMNLVRHRNVLAGFDALVVPERTSLILRRLLGRRVPRLIYTRHGSGDRSIGVSPAAGKFDLVLFSGRKILNRFLEKDYLRPGQYAVVGYPKFDTLTRITKKRFFDNGRPTVLYNPHPDPKLSSFYDMGMDVLDYFYNSDRYNLIFAPHIMMFKRKLHISLESFRMRLRREIPQRFLNCPHILVDTGSPALLDMTYTRSADIYIGDASSQVYEFAIEPRPCVFLNSHNAQWRDNANYLFWTFGPVISDPRDLDRALAVAHEPRYRTVQDLVVRQTFDSNGRPASARAADAIAEFLDAGGGPAADRSYAEKLECA